jgi:hypothetical protein
MPEPLGRLRRQPGLAFEHAIQRRANASGIARAAGVQKRRQRVAQFICG